MLRFMLYATYDRIAKTLGEPFIAINDDMAKIRFEKTLEKLKENKLETKYLTVLNLGYIEMRMKERKENNNIYFERNIYENHLIYDLYNVNTEIEIRKNEEEICKIDPEEIKKEVNKVLYNQ